MSNVYVEGKWSEREGYIYMWTCLKMDIRYCVCMVYITWRYIYIYNLDAAIFLSGNSDCDRCLNSLLLREGRLFKLRYDLEKNNEAFWGLLGGSEYACRFKLLMRS